MNRDWQSKRKKDIVKKKNEEFKQLRKELRNKLHREKNLVRDMVHCMVGDNCDLNHFIRNGLKTVVRFVKIRINIA